MKSVATKEKQSKKELERAQLEKDKARAEVLMKVYEDLKKEEEELNIEHAKNIKPFLEDYQAKVKPMVDLHESKILTIGESITSAHTELLEIAARQRKTMFDMTNNWQFDNGYYLHVKTETVANMGATFNMSKFIRKFGEYVDVKFKIRELKALFTDGDARKKSKIENYDFDLQETDKEIEIKRKAIKKQ